MDKCQQVKDLLSDYRTGMLSARKSAWLEAHVSHCPECARELHMLDEVLEFVDANTPEYEPPTGLWDGVYNQITLTESKHQPLTGISKHLTAKPLRFLGVGAAALALIIGIIFSGTRDDSVVPVNVTSSNEYVQGHVLYAGQAPLANRVSYLSLIASGQMDSK